MTKQEAETAVRKYGSARKAAKALKCCSKTISRALLGVPAVRNGAGVSPRGRPLAEFRSQYDKGYIVPRRIKAALAELGAGWEYEVGFAKLAGLNLSDLGAFRDQFAENVVVLGRDGRRAWAGTRATAEAMRKML